MATEFKSYLPAVKFTANSNSNTIPIWDLRIAAIPYSGSGNIAQENFDGSITQKIDGWILMAAFEMNMHHQGDDHVNFGSVIDDLEAGGTVVVDFDPVDDPGVKTGTFVLNEGGDALAADFSGHVRNRPVSLELIGTSVLASIPSWLTAAGTF